MRVWMLQVMAVAAAFGCSARATPLAFEEVCDRARELAGQPFQPTTNTVPDSLLKLTYVEHAAIQFRPEAALWRNEKLPFQIEFFHPGYVHERTVTIHEADATGEHLVPFSSESFSYGTNQACRMTSGGYAGFRITHPVQDFGEVASFLGATYFRMIGRGQVYGTSARGMALDTAALGKEEFPVFREFWVCKPARKDKQIVVFALMDSVSLAGAFEFIIKPGVTTVANVTAAFFPRRDIQEFGIAPLTSMFLHDENSHPPNRDFRSEVHDADGLLLHTGRDEWIWRPLEKGNMMRVNAYQDENPRGCGLMQRDRSFEHYQDLVGKFESRPSVWVKPRGNWGKGAVTLIQLPSKREFTDNVVAFWVPSVPPKCGESIVLNYELHWLTNHIVPEGLGRAETTRVGQVIEEPPKDPPNLRFVIDFAGEKMESLTAKEQLQADIRCSDGAKVVADTLLKNHINGTWRLVIEISQPSKAVDLQAFLKHRDRPVTETWTYTWQP